MKYRIVAIVLMLFLFVGCKDKPTNDFVFDKFKSAIEKKGLKIDSVDKTGLIYVRLRGVDLKVSLDNVRKDFERDKDTAQISNYVEALDSSIVDLPQTWDEVKDHVYISLFPADYNFGELLHSKVTDNFEQVYVVSFRRNFTWIDNKDLKKWGKTVAELVQQANTNGDMLLAKSEIGFDTIENRRLGRFETEHETLKGALLFAPSLKTRIKQDFGFPFYAVIPVRDFCWVFSEKDFKFFSKKLGATVVDEYNRSGHPITTEILKFTDKGVEAVGKYRNE